MIDALLFIIVVFVFKIWYTLRMLNEAQSRSTDDND